MADSPGTAVLFDIDGTLVDSNFQHVDAWTRAFDAVGERVDAWRIHRLIGMDGSMLLEELLGTSESDAAQQAKAFQTAYFAEHLDRLHLLPGARELLGALSDRGHAVVLATSAPENELAVLRGLLDIEGALWAVTGGDDVEAAKPDPGIVQNALAQAGVDADHAVMVGDAMWDVRAAGRAGVRCIGVRSGGVSDSELTDAGAIAVYDDPADLLAHLDDSPLADLRP
ncbi:HAD family hydrolase [Curtobacterium sp. Leaf261]|uniref:HAD family hydrolase n=1 Tax=Curtobacterium sp. Leaf261 TaxID=1736311 RepID=UPI00070018D9|nr:HAD family hydrolase [Curtobacterium sp. Leaf261]KQO61236.1 HAD family hydrolase [Curtobacterium sp. Leaf261]